MNRLDRTDAPTPAFLPRIVPAASLIVALVGGYWLLERTVLK